MRERVVTFGEDGRLVGIVSEPGTADASRSRIGVVFVNSGLLHHVGPFRLYVELARHLSEQGFISLRFDLGGLGDSSPAPNPKPDQEQTILDIQLAMDSLEKKYHFSQFILIGLCTGAVNAHRAAVADSRVIGLCALSGYAYRTPRFYLHRYAPVLFNPKRLWPVAVRTANRLWRGSPPTHAPAPKKASIGWWTLPPKETFISECRQLFERDVKILAIFTAGDQYYQYKNQLRDTLSSVKPGTNLVLKINQQADHTYSDATQRSHLSGQISTWLTGLPETQGRTDT